MKRKLEITLEIDYDELMKEKGIKKIPDGYISDEENDVIENLIIKIGQENPLIQNINMVVEEFKEKTSRGFERSNKMGSSCSRGWHGLNSYKITAKTKNSQEKKQ